VQLGFVITFLNLKIVVHFVVQFCLICWGYFPIVHGLHLYNLFNLKGNVGCMGYRSFVVLCNACFSLHQFDLKIGRK
jgi:hypothetical protein